MVTVRIEGVYRVTAKGREYFYAWRGGPRLHARPGTPEFLQELQEATANRGGPIDRSKVAGLVTLYKASDDWKGLADKTRKDWAPWLDRIVEKFGKTRVAAFDRPLIRVAIKAWRDKWKATPRTADFALQVLSRVLSFGVDQGLLLANPCRGIKRLYSNNRADIIWTGEDLAAIEALASREVMLAIRLGALTGLRKTDLLKLSWSHVKAKSIEIRTGKSRQRKTTIIPVYRELRELLESIDKRSTTVLTNQSGASWRGGFDASYQPAKTKAGLAHHHFHDLRGTAATRMYLGGLSIRAISAIFTWSEDVTEALIDKYVRKDAILQDQIDQLDALESRTLAAKPGAKP